SLDDILCDPVAAAEFDAIAHNYAPDCQSLDYRLGALKLRKAAKNARTHSKSLKFGRLVDPIPVSSSNWPKIPKHAGAYLVLNEEGSLYAGESLNLHSRFTYQFSSDTRKAWGQRLSVRYFTVEPDATLLLAYQSLFVQKYSPRHN